MAEQSDEQGFPRQEQCGVSQGKAYAEVALKALQAGSSPEWRNLRPTMPSPLHRARQGRAWLF